MTLVGVFKILLSRDDDEVEQTLQNFFCKMFLIGRAVCFVLAILFTVIAVITNSQYSTRKVPPPKPFFTRETWVEDFYEGELYYALLKATKYDVIFLMLYAPWDADSQSARSEFETACRFFHKKVYCAAVNCWHANAGCKAFFDNIVMYPMFLVDLHNIPSIKYNGELVASHMIRFLSSVMKPLERICSVEEFHTLTNTCDALIVSFLPDYKWYKRYYTASLRILEYDPRREVCWSVITDDNLAELLNVKEFSMKLYLWNETKEFDDSFSNKKIIKWVRENVQMLTQWIFFKNARSNRLADLVQYNPAVILFAPRNMYLDHVPSYLLFKEAVMEFKNCFVDLNIKKSRTFIAGKRKKVIDDYNHWEKVCNARFNFKAESYNSKIFDIIDQNYNKYVFTSVSGLSNVTQAEFAKRTGGASRKSTLETHRFTLNFSEDDRSSQNLVRLHVREKCRQLNLLKKTYKYTSLSKFEDQTDHAVPDALCRLNNTYSFFAVDSLLYSHFATALGINLNNFKDRTTLVVFNNLNEEAFVLPVDFDNKRALHEFMVNTTNYVIPRWMKSTEDSLMHINLYNKSNNPIPDETAVVELNSGSFLPVVFNSTQHVVVYYYTPYCSYCQVSAYSFLYVAHALRTFKHITFARIDGENNDLPWYLVPQSYPTIIVFPAKRKTESVVFPSLRELTTENLFEFVLSNVDVETKLSYMAGECDKYKLMEYKAADIMFGQCINQVKTYCLQLINNLVWKYKETTMSDVPASNSSSSTKLQTILDRLKYLKSVYFHLDNLCGV